MPPQLNPDGVSVKGCSIIYAPVGRAGEYSPLAANPYTNCGNECIYCYVPKVIPSYRRMGTQEAYATFHSAAIPRKNYLHLLELDAKKYRALGITEQVMLSFTTDPYHPGDTTLTRQVLIKLHEYGLGFCTLTKGGSRALRDLDLFRPGRDAYAASLTALDDGLSLKWEKKAALPQDRIEALKKFHDAGIFTWVSLEPVLDPAQTLEIIRHTHKFVDRFKIGKTNYIEFAVPIDWKKFTEDVVEVLALTGAKGYIKHDLHQYLPPGYVNIMRVDQFYREEQEEEEEDEQRPELSNSEEPSSSLIQIQNIMADTATPSISGPVSERRDATMIETDIVAEFEEFICDYASVPDPSQVLPIALWAIATHCFQKFDVFGYLVSTSRSPGAGKTRMLEILECLCHKGKILAKVTLPGMCSLIEKYSPTLLIDQAERLGKDEHNDLMSCILSGYRDGQTVTVQYKGEAYER